MTSAPDADARLEMFDPFDTDQSRRHHEVMAQMRQRGALTRLGSGMAVVSRYDDVRQVLNAPAMRNSHAARAPGVAVPEEDRLFFFEYDPPEHAVLRRLLLDLLSRQQALRMHTPMRLLAAELLAPLVTSGRADVVAGFSVPFAGRLMMRVAGFPEEDAPRWRRWISDMVLSGFSFTNRNDRGTGFEQCYPEVLAYLDEHMDARRSGRDRPDDVLSRVVDPAIEPGPLSLTHQRMILFSVVSAGTNTLVNFLSNTFASIAGDATLLQDLRGDATLIPAVVEESLRRDSPSMFITRVCGAATSVHGEPVHPDEKLLLGLASANRDDAVYPEPDRFRLDRHDQPSHLAFGWGAHLCLGAWIARQAGAAVLETLVESVGSMDLDPGAPPAPYLSPQGNGFERLWVTLTPARE